MSYWTSFRATRMPSAEHLQSLVRKAAGSNGGRVASFLAILVVILTVLGICLKAIFSRRKVERLMSEMRKADEVKLQAQEDEDISECQERRAAAREKIRAMELQVESLKEEVEKRRREHKARVKELDAVVNWDDLTVLDLREDSGYSPTHVGAPSASHDDRV